MRSDTIIKINRLHLDNQLRNPQGRPYQLISAFQMKGMELQHDGARSDGQAVLVVVSRDAAPPDLLVVLGVTGVGNGESR
jgi:hypothetical protein